MKLAIFFRKLLCSYIYASWGFLTSHARVLLCIAHDPGTRLRDIAASASGNHFLPCGDLAEMDGATITLACHPGTRPCRGDGDVLRTRTGRCMARRDR